MHSFHTVLEPRMTDDCHYQMLVFLACATTSEPKGSDWCRVKLNRISDFVPDFFLFPLNPKKSQLSHSNIMKKSMYNTEKLVQSLNKRELGPIWSFLGWS